MKQHYSIISDEEIHCILRTMIMHTGGIEMTVHVFITFTVRIFSPVGLYDI